MLPTVLNILPSGRFLHISYSPFYTYTPVPNSPSADSLETPCRIEACGTIISSAVDFSLLGIIIFYPLWYPTGPPTSFSLKGEIHRIASSEICDMLRCDAKPCYVIQRPNDGRLRTLSRATVGVACIAPVIPILTLPVLHNAVFIAIRLTTGLNTTAPNSCLPLDVVVITSLWIWDLPPSCEHFLSSFTPRD